MIMARPRKPTALLELVGAFDKNPARRRDRAPEPAGIGNVGDPPSRLTLEQRRAWREIVTNAIPGVIGRSDRLALESFARLLAQEWSGGLTGPERTALGKFFSTFGMTPGDRSRPPVPP